MSIGLVIALFVLLVLVVMLGVAALPRERRRALGERERAIAAQIEVEENDIAEMLEARARLRRERGQPSIGEELVDEVFDPRRGA